MSNILVQGGTGQQRGGGEDCTFCATSRCRCRRGCLACFAWQLQPAQRCSERAGTECPVGAAVDLILQTHYAGRVQPHVFLSGGGKFPIGGLC